MTTPDQRLRRLVEAALPQARPDEQTRARSKAQLLARLQPPPTPPTDPEGDPSTSEAGPAAPIGKTMLLKAAAVVLAAGGLGAAAVGTARGRPAASSDPVVVRAPARPRPPESTAATTPADDEVSVAPDRAQPNATAASVIVHDAPGRGPRAFDRRPPAHAGTTALESSLRAEADLISRAQASLARGEAQSARALLRSHRLQFPQGQLARERDALLLVIACRLEEATAQDVAFEFVERHPNVFATDRVRAECKLQDR